MPVGGFVELGAGAVGGAGNGALAFSPVHNLSVKMVNGHGVILRLARLFGLLPSPATASQRRDFDSPPGFFDPVEDEHDIRPNNPLPLPWGKFAPRTSSNAIPSPTADKLAARKTPNLEATFIRRLRTRREATYKCALLCTLLPFTPGGGWRASGNAWRLRRLRRASPNKGSVCERRRERDAGQPANTENPKTQRVRSRRPSPLSWRHI